MNELPILFKPEMVKAILEGRKTQTRRVVKHVPALGEPGHWCHLIKDSPIPFQRSLGDFRSYCPYGEVGDRLWVREMWQYYDWSEDGEPFIRYAADNHAELRRPTEEWAERVESIWEELSRNDNYKIDSRARDRKWRPSLLMPRWAGRLTLEITDIRLERVQDITEDDAIAEGVTVHLDAVMAGAVSQDSPARMEFWDLWNSIHKNDGKHWDANPWVWVITFKKIT
jgi:hypothetical protein